MATAKKAAETATPKTIDAPEITPAEVEEQAPTVDVVAAVSYRADGTPDQTPGFEVLVPEDESEDDKSK